jgi:aspartyl-tRNA(Asn)/glutamyl-tRNA(Gln) amidotransferase subunit C
MKLLIYSHQQQRKYRYIIDNNQSILCRKIYENPVLEEITNLLYGCFIQSISRGKSVKITEDEVMRVSKLARLRLEPKETVRFQKDLSAILEYMDMLNDVDTTGIEPTFHTHSITDAVREDEVERSQSIEDALLNAPQRHDGTIVVPKVLE